MFSFSFQGNDLQVKDKAIIPQGQLIYVVDQQQPALQPMVAEDKLEERRGLGIDLEGDKEESDDDEEPVYT